MVPSKDHKKFGRLEWNALVIRTIFQSEASPETEAAFLNLQRGSAGTVPA